jgi:hypothetical protein
MRTYTVLQREGELLGPVDWSYDFRSHFNGYGGDDAARDRYCAEKIEQLRKLTDGEWQATTDGGWPRCGWGKVLAVGMYDGWPYWHPVPSVLIAGPLGGEWHSFASVTSIEPL